jgi:pseudouridine-5'-phosphate glycosidase
LYDETLKKQCPAGVKFAVALAEADRLGIRGKDITPFLLSEIVQATEGRSLQANIALVKNNARVAAEIAVAFARS